jgi:hypothetical protein
MDLLRAIVSAKGGFQPLFPFAWKYDFEELRRGVIDEP